MYQRTLACVEKAQQLLGSSSDPDQIRYACLQLRMAIEYLFYDLIPLYEQELPTDILEKWQPKQIIDAILECDPEAEQDATLTFSDMPDHGDVSAFFEGRQNRPSRKLLKHHYHKLGAYLHAPIVPQEKPWQDVTEFGRKTAEVLRQFRETTVLANIRKHVTFQCSCGRTIVRNIRALEVNPRVKCPDVNCGAFFDFQPVDESGGTFTPVESQITCPKCGVKNRIGTHLIQDGLEVICDHCEAKVRLHVGYEIRPI